MCDNKIYLIDISKEFGASLLIKWRDSQAATTADCKSALI